MANAITIPSLQGNGVIIEIVPNSLVIRRGFGTTDVKAQSSGSTVTSVFQKNQENAVGYLTFDIYSTQESIDQIRTLQDNNPNNTMQITQDGFSRTMPQAAVSNDPDLGLGADKTISVEMMGDQIT